MTDASNDALLARTLEGTYARYVSNGTDPARAHFRRELAGVFMRFLGRGGGTYGISLGHHEESNQVSRYLPGGRPWTPRIEAVTSTLPAPPERPLGGPPLDPTDGGYEERTTNALRRLCEDLMDPRSPTVVAVGNIQTDGPGGTQHALIDVNDGEFENARTPTHAVRLGLAFDGTWCGRLDVMPIPKEWTEGDRFGWLKQTVNVDSLE